MASQHNSQTGQHDPIVYHIRVKGHFDNQWTDWFEDMSIILEEGGYTLLSGPVVDQAALYGLLRKIRDLGIPLISVYRAYPDSDVPDING